jgi:hypothetical protein
LVVDVFSRYLWVEMLKTKDEALAYLKKIMTREENEQGSKLKALRTDREGNYIPIFSQYFAHLRIFGCFAHVKDVGPRVTRLSDRSKKMMLLEAGTEGYQLLDPLTGRLHVSRDVIFEEDQDWCWNNSNSEPEEIKCRLSLSRNRFSRCESVPSNTCYTTSSTPTRDSVGNSTI